MFNRRGNRDITTNTILVTGSRSRRQITWVDVDWHSLESDGPTILNEMMRHSFVISRAIKDVVAPAVMGLATPSLRAIDQVIYGQSEFPQHTKHEVPILDAVAWDAAAHCNEGGGICGERIPAK